MFKLHMFYQKIEQILWWIIPLVSRKCIISRILIHIWIRLRLNLDFVRTKKFKRQFISIINHLCFWTLIQRAQINDSQNFTWIYDGSCWLALAQHENGPKFKLESGHYQSSKQFEQQTAIKSEMNCVWLEEHWVAQLNNAELFGLELCKRRSKDIRM